MRSALAKLFLAIAAFSLRETARLLQRSDKLRRLEAGDQQILVSHTTAVSERMGEILRVIRAVQGVGAGDRALAGFTFSQSNAPGQPKIIIFDLVDGSQCYYIDPPGVCCCGSC
jgi:hypothetical protein